MVNVELIFQKGQHISRLLTGFNLLEREHEVRCSYIDNASCAVKLPDHAIVEARIKGKRIAFDMGDRMALNHSEGIEYLSLVDAYFARSYDEKLVKELPWHQAKKVKPFGFDYYMTYPGNPADNPPTGVKEKIRQLARDISGYSRCMYVDAFEQDPDYKAENLKIIFMTRLWDPAEIELNEQTPVALRPYRQYMKEERSKINEDRIHLIRQLRERYRDAFVGGIQHSAFAEAMCPDVLIPKELTRKRTYLEKMHKSDICIGSMGLHKSIGWKTGEYVAASRAIVAERFHYQLPGDFREGSNYLSFDTVEECLEKVNQLYTNPDMVYALKKANQIYYQRWLRPEEQIKRAFEQVF